MPWPPVIPPATRADTTAQAAAHASDHNAVANALNDVVTRVNGNVRAGAGMASGLQIMGGRVSVTSDASGLFTITLPGAFPTAVLSAVAINANAAQGGQTIYAYNVATLNTVQFYCLTSVSGQPQLSKVCTINWIVIGN